jgi:3-phosphoshikimate 1-carboxyvinyltransferase
MRHTRTDSDMDALREVRVPGDKSISHRALLFAALAEGDSTLHGVLAGEDCQSTAAALRALGVAIPPIPVPVTGSADPESGTAADPSEPLRIRGVGLTGLAGLHGRAGLRGDGSAPAPGIASGSVLLDCGNSGTTARLLMGILAGAQIRAHLTGDASLQSRPMRRVTGPLQEMGAAFFEHGLPDRLPIEVESGRPLGPGQFRLAVASAQVKSAILLAGLLSGNRVEVIEPERSRDHTERMLSAMGVSLEEGPAPGGGWRVVLPATAGPLSALHLDVPGDPSSAAFLVALAVLGGAGPGLRLVHVGLNPTRIGALRVLERMGAKLRIVPDDSPDGTKAPPEPTGSIDAMPSRLVATRIEGAEIPSLIDELPLLAAVAARAEGVTEIRDAGELRVKESDRIAVMAENLRRIGVRVEEHPDGLDIHGCPDVRLRGAILPEGDHRIAMAFGVLGALPGHAIEVHEPGVVEVSFPGFWELLSAVSAPPPPLSEGARADISSPAANLEIGGSGHPPIITLDGPAGSGKSTTARAVAAALGIPHLDSGALYRAVTLCLLEEGWPADAWDRLTREVLDGWDIRFVSTDTGLEIRIRGENPGLRLRSREVTDRVSPVSALPVVRDWLLEAQRDAARQRGIVADGRDMGTVVFPEADLKVFMEADLEARARRRLLEGAGGAAAALDPKRVSEEATRMGARDDADRSRALAPLRAAPDALHLDTTRLTFEEQVARVVAWARSSHPWLQTGSRP